MNQEKNKNWDDLYGLGTLPVEVFEKVKQDAQFKDILIDMKSPKTWWDHESINKRLSKIVRPILISFRIRSIEKPYKIGMTFTNAYDLRKYEIHDVQEHMTEKRGTLERTYEVKTVGDHPNFGVISERTITESLRAMMSKEDPEGLDLL